MKQILFSLFFLFFSIIILAQEIELNIPTASYMQYNLAVKQGSLLDTIAVGRFDKDGKALFSIPETYSFYRGVGNLSVTSKALNVNIIFNGEDKIKVIEDTIKHELSAFSDENDYLLNATQKLKKIATDYAQAREVNEQSSLIFSLPSLKIYEIQKSYENFWKENSKDSHYAARIVELLACLTGTGGALMPPDSIVKQQHQFITNDLDFDFLYTSGFWQLTMDTWRRAEIDDSLLLADAKIMLDRVGENRFIQRELTETIIKDFIKYGKDNLLVELGADYLTIPINGVEAPEIEIEDSFFAPKKSLILFYESNCGNCHNELAELKKKYSLLSDNHNQIRIITISADTDKDLNDSTAKTFLWKDNICSLKGFNDPNFTNYGVMGTPTYIFVDKDGIIQGRYFSLKELLNE